MSKAMLWLLDGSFKVIEPEKAVNIWSVLNGETEPTEEQATFLPNVKDVFLPPSYHAQAPGYREAHKHVARGFTADQAVSLNTTPLADPKGLEQPHKRPELTHEGVLQGMNEALPRGDR